MVHNGSPRSKLCSHKAITLSGLDNAIFISIFFKLDWAFLYCDLLGCIIVFFFKQGIHLCEVCFLSIFILYQFIFHNQRGE